MTDRSRGQSLVELAVCLPVILLLVLGGASLARVADARAGLEAATAAAVAEAARAPDPASGTAVAAARFAAVAGRYPLQSATFKINLGAFQRGATVTGTATATVDLAFAPLPGLPRQLPLAAAAQATLEPWRSRVDPPSRPEPSPWDPCRRCRRP